MTAGTARTRSRASSWSTARVTVLASFVLLLLVLFVYRGIWDNGFYKDDFHWLLVARTIAESPLSLFAHDAINPEVAVRVTQRIAMGLTWAMFGAGAAAHHVVSLLLHVACSVVVFRFLLALQERSGATNHGEALMVAALGSAFFATTRNHSMAVMWLSAQSGIFEAALLTLLMIFLLRSRTTLLNPRTLVPAVAIFVAALYSKNTAVAFPVVIVAVGLLRPWGTKDVAPRKDWLVTGALLLGVSALHLVFTKLVLFGGSWSGVTEKTAVSLNVLDNLSGALLAPLLSADDFARIFGTSVPHPLVAVIFAGALLGLGRAFGVTRPVAWGMVWMLAAALPVTFMDYDQYDAVQVTVNRYSYTPMVGAMVVVGFLVRGVFARMPRRQPVMVAVCLALLAAHVAWYAPQMQRDLRILRNWGRALETVIEKTLDRARTSIPRGTTIFAFDWPTENAFVRCIGALHVDPAGYDLQVPDDPARVIGEFRRGQHRDAWAAVYDAANEQFGTMPMGEYVKWLDRGGS